MQVADQSYWDMSINSGAPVFLKIYIFFQAVAQGLFLKVRTRDVAREMGEIRVMSLAIWTLSFLYEHSTKYGPNKIDCNLLFSGQPGKSLVISRPALVVRKTINLSSRECFISVLDCFHGRNCSLQDHYFSFKSSPPFRRETLGNPSINVGRKF